MSCTARVVNHKAEGAFALIRTVVRTSQKCTRHPYVHNNTIPLTLILGGQRRNELLFPTAKLALLGNGLSEMRSVSSR